MPDNYITFTANFAFNKSSKVHDGLLRAGYSQGKGSKRRAPILPGSQDDQNAHASLAYVGIKKNWAKQLDAMTFDERTVTEFIGDKSIGPKMPEIETPHIGIQYNTGIKAAIDAAKAQIRALALSIWDGIKAAFAFDIDISFDTFWAFIASAIERMASSFVNCWTALKVIAEKVLDFAKGVLDSIAEFFTIIFKIPGVLSQAYATWKRYKKIHSIKNVIERNNNHEEYIVLRSIWDMANSKFKSEVAKDILTGVTSVLSAALPGFGPLVKGGVAILKGIASVISTIYFWVMDFFGVHKANISLSYKRTSVAITQCPFLAAWVFKNMNMNDEIKSPILANSAAEVLKISHWDIY
jgi:hypothetical protein